MLRIDAKKHFALFAVLLATITLLLTPATAQRADGTVRGEVVDNSGAVVGNAKVTVTNDATNVSTTTVTSNSGAYSIPNLLIGTYTVKVEAKGFSTYTRRLVNVLAAQVIEVSAKLTVGSNDVVVDVQAGANAVQTETSQLTNSFDQKSVVEIPTGVGAGGGSQLNLAIFVPNTTAAAGGTSGTGGSVGGLRGRQNSFSIDGANNDDPSVTVSSQPVIQDSIAEFAISTNHYSAEYGHASGGQFNTVLKSGTNQYHGKGWEYFQNRGLNAANSTEKTAILAGRQFDKNRFDYNDFGGDLSGPIIKNHLFAYGSYQYSPTGLGSSATAILTPTAAGLATLNGLASNAAVKAVMAQFPVAPANDGGTVGVTNAGGTCVTASATCTLIPIGFFSAVAPSYRNQKDWYVGTDLNLAKHTMRWRYLDTSVLSPSFGSVPQPQFASGVSTTYKKAIFDEVWTISNRLVNDFKASSSRLNSSFPLTGTALAYPTVLITGLTGFAIGPNGNFPQSRITNQYQLADSMSYAVGRNTWKWGGEYRWYTSPSVFLQNQRGQYSYGSLSELVNDLVPTITNASLQGVGDGSFSGNASGISWFIQDDLKVTPRLTLNMGLRYEFNGNAKGARKQQLNSIASLPNNGTTVNFDPALVFHAPAEDKNNFSPRLGFAWDPTGSGKWAIRGGAGIGYDVTPQNFITNGAPPQLQAIPNPVTACAGVLAVAPVWCPTGKGFLAGGAMQGTYAPPSTQAAARTATGNLLPDIVAPKVIDWTFSVQHEIMKNTTVEVRYLGTHAMHLPVQTQIQGITPFERGFPGLPTYFTSASIPATVAATVPTQSQFNALVGTGANNRFAGTGFVNTITFYRQTGQSLYHGGSVDLVHSFDHGLQARFNWTHSKNISNADNDLNTSGYNPRRPENSYNLNAERSLSALDATNKFAMTYVYELPKVHSENILARTFLHGWTYSGSWLWQTGQPVTVQSGVDSNGNGDAAGDRALTNPNVAPSLTGTTVSFVCRAAATGVTSTTASVGACAGGAANIVGYVANDPTAYFVQARQGVITTTGRDSVRAPGLNQWNMAFGKTTKITERVNMQFRVDAFDVFNHRQFTPGAATVFAPTGAGSTYSNLADPNFLKAPKFFDGGSRTLQLALKFGF